MASFSYLHRSFTDCPHAPVRVDLSGVVQILSSLAQMDRCGKATSPKLTYPHEFLFQAALRPGS